MMMEIFIAMVAPYPFFNEIKISEEVYNWGVVIDYALNDHLLFFMFCRVYLVLKFILYMTDFMIPRSQRVCNLNGCDATKAFAIKGYMKQKPYQLLCFSLSVTTLIFGF